MSRLLRLYLLSLHFYLLAPPKHSFLNNLPHITQNVAYIGIPLWKYFIILQHTYKSPNVLQLEEIINKKIWGPTHMTWYYFIGVFLFNIMSKWNTYTLDVSFISEVLYTTTRIGKKRNPHPLLSLFSYYTFIKATHKHG